MQRDGRAKPNILVTGTPGTGKSATVEGALEQAPHMRGLNVGQVVREHRFHEEGDEEGAVVIDEDRLLDHLEDVLAPGGFIVEHHGCELFPERWFDAVVVLTTDNTLLWDRLEQRGYSEAKIGANVECEIMEVVAEEARESYAPGVVHVWPSDTAEQLVANVRALALLAAPSSQ